MLKEPGDTIVRLISEVSPSTGRPWEAPHGWRKVDIPSSPNRANASSASGKTVDLQRFSCLEMASVRGKKGAGITLPRTNCARCSRAAGMR